MKLHGWCEKCHKIRRVNVSGSGLARMAGGCTATGICDECLDAEDAQRDARRGARR